MDTDCIICYENDDLVQLKDIYGCACVKPIHKKCYEGINGKHTVECLMCHKIRPLSKLTKCKLFMIDYINHIILDVEVGVKHPFLCVLLLTFILLNTTPTPVSKVDTKCEDILGMMQFESSAQAEAYCRMVINYRIFQSYSRKLDMGFESSIQTKTYEQISIIITKYKYQQKLIEKWSNITTFDSDPPKVFLA